eukprot:1369884-Rhodomonas_salina.1
MPCKIRPAVRGGALTDRRNVALSHSPMLSSPAPAALSLFPPTSSSFSPPIPAKAPASAAAPIPPISFSLKHSLSSSAHCGKHMARFSAPVSSSALSLRSSAVSATHSASTEPTRLTPFDPRPLSRRSWHHHICYLSTTQ